MVPECLDLRKKYVYKEKVAPWKAEPVAKKSDPFHFEPVEATSRNLLLSAAFVSIFEAFV
ncbi:hypothetical protein EI013_28925 [Escherichia coli]|nr:hypothetical protein [Escherichia coli]